MFEVAGGRFRRWPKGLAEAGSLTRDQNIEDGVTVNRYVLTAAGRRTEGKGRFKLSLRDEGRSRYRSFWVPQVRAS